jgi:O-6-methylguanine DNA methyltransferase
MIHTKILKIKFKNLSQFYYLALIYEIQKNNLILYKIIPPLKKLHLKEELKKLNLEKLKNKKIIFYNLKLKNLTQSLKLYCEKSKPIFNIFKNPECEVIGFSNFQKKVYQHTNTISFGTTVSYSWFETKLKRKNIKRAVGQTLKNNRFPLLIACHRVVNKNGNLGGYMGSATKNSPYLSLKKNLLNLEKYKNVAI